MRSKQQSEPVIQGFEIGDFAVYYRQQEGRWIRTITLRDLTIAMHELDAGVAKQQIQALKEINR